MQVVHLGLFHIAYRHMKTHTHIHSLSEYNIANGMSVERLFLKCFLFLFVRCIFVSSQYFIPEYYLVEMEFVIFFVGIHMLFFLSVHTKGISFDLRQHPHPITISTGNISQSCCLSWNQFLLCLLAAHSPYHIVSSSFIGQRYPPSCQYIQDLSLNIYHHYQSVSLIFCHFVVLQSF